jgi:hypothetical protein
MNDILDVLLIRILFILIISGLIFLYKICHLLLYPSSKIHFQENFFPSKNPSETIFLFSRILGIGLIFSDFSIFLNGGFFLAGFDFILTSLVTFFLYLLSLYILESIVLSDFEYSEEITRKNNIPYAIVSSSFSIGFPFLFQTYLNQSMLNFSHNILYIILMWSITIVLVGFSVKSFPFASKLDFSNLLGKKSLALGFSYFGFFLAWMIIIASAINLDIYDIKAFAIGVVVRIILSLLLLPLFKIMLVFIFRIKEDFERKTWDENNEMPSLGFGIYEGIIILTSAYMTTLVTSKISFPTL